MIDEKRVLAALEIIKNPQSYKICEGCDSIVKTTNNICPNCHSYRYNYETQEVIDQAIRLSKSEQKSVTKDDLF
jgi:uncharacterized paraquat-inducible protein A